MRPLSSEHNENYIFIKTDFYEIVSGLLSFTVSFSFFDQWKKGFFITKQKKNILFQLGKLGTE